MTKIMEEIRQLVDDARRISLEVIPVYLLAVYAGLFGFYVLAVRYRKRQAATVSVPSEHAIQQQENTSRKN